MLTSESPSASWGELFANRNFRWLWIGQTISQLGDSLSVYALLMLVNRLTEASAGAIGLLLIVWGIPRLIGPITGVYVDRLDRKRLMIVSDLIRAVLVLAFVMVRSAEGLWILYAVAFLTSTVATIFDPAKTALLPNILEERLLLKANSLSQMTLIATAVLGASAAGVLVGVANNAAPAFIVDSLSFVISAIFIALMIIPSHKRTDSSDGVRAILAETWDGLRFVGTQQMVLGVMLSLSVAMLGLGAVDTLFIPFLTMDLGIGEEWFGLFKAGQMAGIVIGTIAVGSFSARLKPQHIVTGAMVMLGSALAVIMLLSGSMAEVTGVFALVGLAVGPLNAAIATVMQTFVPDEMRGRASSALNAATQVAYLVSVGAAGIVADSLGTRPVFVGAGGLALLAAGIAAVMMRGEPAAETVPGLEESLAR
jgi:DHA3 family macrolide efflux protein-like MFS transporter